MLFSFLAKFICEVHVELVETLDVVPFCEASYGMHGCFCLTMGQANDVIWRLISSPSISPFLCSLCLSLGPIGKPLPNQQHKTLDSWQHEPIAPSGGANLCSTLPCA